MKVIVGLVLLALTVQLNAFPFTHKKHETKGVFPLRNIPVLAKEVRQLVNKIKVGKRHQIFSRHSEECDTIYAAFQEYVDASAAAERPLEEVLSGMHDILPAGYVTSTSDEELRRASCYWAEFTREKMMEVMADRYNINTQSEAEEKWRALSNEVLMGIRMLENMLPGMQGNPNIPENQINLYTKSLAFLKALRDAGVFEVPA